MILGNSEAVSCPFSLFLLLAVYGVIKQPRELGLELSSCLKPQESLEGLWGRGGDQSVSSRLPGAATPPSIRGDEQRPLPELNYQGDFADSEAQRWGQGSFPGHQCHVGLSLDNAGIVISASWPCCIPLHPCQKLGKAWNSLIPILFSPPGCASRSPSGPCDPQPQISHPLSLCVPITAGIYLMLGIWGQAGGGCQHHFGNSCAITTRPALSSRAWMNSHVSPASSAPGGNSL